LIYAKVVDHEPLRYSVLDKTKRCMAIDLGQEMKSILTGKFFFFSKVMNDSKKLNQTKLKAIRRNQKNSLE